MAEIGHAQFHERDQAVPARHDARVVAMLFEELDRRRHVLWPVILE